MQNRSKNPEGTINSQKGNQAQGAGRSAGAKRSKKPNLILPILLVLMGCAVFLFAAWSAVTSPVMASILNLAAAPQEQAAPRQSFAQVNIAKPASMAPVAVQPLIESSAPQLPAATAVEESLPVIVDAAPTAAPTLEPTLEPTAIPQQTEAPLVAQIVDDSALPTATSDVTAPQATVEPGGVSAQIVSDTPTSEYTAPTAVAYAPVTGSGERWIDVNLSEQRVYAYEGDTLVNSFIVSTGTWQTPTVTGKYKIWIKVRSQAMSGPGYYLPDVPYVMYFYKDYGLHGTYWHNNFGTPMSHGCVNLSIPDSQWLYNFASVGTVVNVHY
ncbi:MAG: L,D-transpeptidase family protein [Anaerolineales bacterium]|nr:L,D-transpeptidase family protein [Anaerolineales bacterium]